MLSKLISAFIALNRCCSTNGFSGQHWISRPRFSLTTASGSAGTKAPPPPREPPQLPLHLIERLGERTLLPVQVAAFELIRSGADAVIYAPTGSGKTMAFVLPLTARLLALQIPPKTKHVPATQSVSPRVVVVCPSRELARQVGKVWAGLYEKPRVATVFGGAPVERHAHMLRGGGGADVVVGTAGRLRELMREGHLDFKRLQTLVLDEADVLLDAKDQPEVAGFLDGMEHDYQLVLCSATITKPVRRFAKETMEIDDASPSFVTVGIDGGGSGVGESPGGEGREGQPGGGSEGGSGAGAAAAPRVRHWRTAAVRGARWGVCADLVSTQSPRTTIVFCATKAEVEDCAAALEAQLGGQQVKVHVLHGDMPQPARARTLASLRAAAHADADATRRQGPAGAGGSGGSGGSGAAGAGVRQRVLVATDVAARGLDLPGVDLVVQLGLPKRKGKDGTFDAELYTHRTGRAGRVGGDLQRPADAVLLFDPSAGEASLLAPLAADARVDLRAKTPPSPAQVMAAAYARACARCAEAEAKVEAGAGAEARAGAWAVSSGSEVGEAGALAAYFEAQLLREATAGGGGDDAPGQVGRLRRRLACALAALSGLDGPAATRSLLTADPSQRTVRVTRCDPADGNRKPAPLNPAQVTQLCKGLGSGKMSRIEVRPLDRVAAPKAAAVEEDTHAFEAAAEEAEEDEAGAGEGEAPPAEAVFDLPVARALRLVETAIADADGALAAAGWTIEIPVTLMDYEPPPPKATSEAKTEE